MRTFHRWLVVLSVLGLAAVAFAQPAQQATVSAAFDKATPKPGESATLNVTVDVQAGFHAQSHTPGDENYIPLTVTLTPPAGLTAGEPAYPKGHDEDYPLLGKLNVYTGKIVIPVSVKIEPGTGGGAAVVKGTVNYQACNDTACFPPQTALFEATLTIDAPPGTTRPATTQAGGLGVGPTDFPGQESTVTHSGEPEAASAFGLSLKKDSYVAAFLAAFLVGIVFNAVPCVLPVVPLKIVGFYEAAHHDRLKCVGLALAFSVGLVASFAVLAVFVVGLRTLTWGGLFQQTWFTVAIVTVLLLMAASQFGLFTINLPTKAYAFSPRHDTAAGNAMFGVLTAALSTPCTIGPFSAVLAWALAQPSATVGGLSVVVVGCGMASPYLLLSAFPEVVRKFPRTGPVGEIIKQTLAFFVLATAVYFARPLVNSFVTHTLFWWTLFTIVAAGMAFLVMRTATAVGTRRAVTISSIIAGLVTTGTLVATVKIAYQPYEWKPYTDAALAEARQSGRPVLIDFTADWCGNCHYLEAFVLNDQKVVDAVRASGAVLLKADVTHGTEPAVPLKDRLVATGEIPLTAFYPPGGGGPAVLKGVYTADELLVLLKRHGV